MITLLYALLSRLAVSERELRQAGAVSDESIMEAVKLVKSRIKNDAA